MKNHPTTLKNRRQFLGDVNRGMIAASIGGALAGDLGFSTAFAEGGESDVGRISFGSYDPLIDLMEQTYPSKLQPILVNKLKNGETTFKELIGAAALMNARACGGRDYDGFHCMMALAPALEMAQEMPDGQQALPVLKVLYRNTSEVHQMLRKKKPDPLQPISPSEFPATASAELLQTANSQRNVDGVERMLGTLAQRSALEAFDGITRIAQQNKTNVHGVALAHRSWEMADIVGQEHAHTLLRQSARFYKDGRPDGELQKVLTSQLSQIESKKLGNRVPDDAWSAEMTRIVFESSRVDAANAVAEALKEGISPEAVGEAISLAANEIVLRQLNNRVHGDSRGVHASDAVNAWRNISRTTTERNRAASLIVAAFQVAGGGHKVVIGRSSDAPLSTDADPLKLFREVASATTPETLLAEAEEAIQANDQFRAAAAITRYGELGGENRPVFDLMLKYAVSEDGRLHAEKFYRTVVEEFATIRPAYRGRQLVALARITASAYGMARSDKKVGRAPGYAEARELLGLG